jgi:ubiquinone biosynthesis protein COQ9
MAENGNRAQQILDTALSLGELHSWEDLRLHQIADAMGITLDEVRVHYREKEDLVEAWFDRADSAMLRDAAAPDFALLPARARLYRLIMTWLDALGPHKRLTRQMISGKLEPGHLHIQIPAILRVSRTVQWIREGARIRTTYLQRALEEASLTSIYVATFVFWMADDSQGTVRTRRFLDRLLVNAETLSQWVFLGQAWSTTELPPLQTPRGAVPVTPPVGDVR